MDQTQAAMFLAAEAAYTKRVSRMTRRELQIDYIDDRRDAGIVVVSGPERMTKDELIGALCRIHYPPLQRNEAIHVRGHDVIWPDCEFCTGPKPCHNCGATAAERCRDWCGAAELRLQPPAPTSVTP